MTAFRRMLSGNFISHAGSAVAAQGVLSATNFLVGLLLLHGAGTQPYARYVLATSAVALVVSLQTAFLGPPLSTRLPGLTDTGRAALVGGLLAEQRHLLSRAGVIVTAVAVVFGLRAIMKHDEDAHGLGLAVVATALVMWSALRREFLRQTLLALRQAHDILRADLLYAATALAGVLLARQLAPWLAPTVLLLAVATGALASRHWLKRALVRDMAPQAGRQPDLLQEILPLALWSTSGAALFWLYTQGFLYLVAAGLGTTAVAALAATRLLLMPMNLLSSGLGGLLAPAAAGWLTTLGRVRLLRRLCGIALGMGVITTLWVGLLYWLREPLFALLFKHPVGHAASLLLAWGAVYVSMALRDQMGYLLTALGRYRQLTLLTTVATLTSLLGCMAGLTWLPDARGAMAGLLAGEAVSLFGVVALATRAARQKPAITPDGIVSPA